ncbi:MAG TPA: AhpC/TSA family protein [Thermoleophilaceae bacterium]|nr:AhpC/TSA family protein [Thermoleophilaceae bacterium]
MNRAREEIEARGAKLVFIGQATPKHAAHFQRRFAPDVPVLADDKRESYKAMGIPRATAAQLLGPKSVLKGISRIATSGQVTVQGRVIGDAAQLGATFIVLPSGKVAWSHVSQDASDNAEPEDVLEALDEVLG